MKTIKRVLRGGTRNQSTADFSRHQLFIFGQRIVDATFSNNTGGELTAEAGILVVRNVTTNNIEPVADNLSNAANIIGILDVTGEVVMADADTLTAHYALKGDIDASELVLPGVTTLDTTVGAKNLRDILTSLGFVLFNVIENSKFDN
jgi:hypothetical protein